MNELLIKALEIICLSIRRNNYICALLFCVALVGCNEQPSPKEYEVPLNEITKQFKAQLALMNSRVIGTGIAVNENKHQIFIYAIEMNNNRRDMATTRRLALEVADLLMRLVNESLEIRPYLKNYPITADDLKILFSFNNAAEAEEQYPVVISGRISRGMVFFSIQNDSSAKDEQEYQETYENAKAQVENGHRDERFRYPPRQQK